ncbi:F-box/kelch-repeat protein SKIP6-like isoform X2 [Punica granatum]|uniref:F-box/kelch-repeat protein SKIP6-like isoform X2 n=1 Tax=Punica granatum TaxID=22663 RepID=A0A6P8DTN2_PUNGR|nr:F-box/kelch-repeat protein SKIP6-like isoform X2 [Punica granatum]
MSATSSPPAPEAQTLIPCLPDDVAVSILARVPRSQHPVLCLVSRAFRSLLSSALFATTRRLLSPTEPSLYLTLRSSSTSSLLCFTLLRRRLVPISPVPSPYIGSAYAVLGPELYVLGGSHNDVASARVWVLDCRFNTWRPGPSMRVPREFAAAGVVDGKLYVMGGCVADTWARAANWAEALDPKTGSWAAVPSPDEVREKWMHASAVIDGKLYAMADRGGVVYDSRREVWSPVENELDNGWRGRACVVDGILYCYDYLGKIRGFDWGEGLWKELKGVEKGLPRFLCGATMANMGGNLIVVWEGKSAVGNGKEMEVWCAEIEDNKTVGTTIQQPIVT